MALPRDDGARAARGQAGPAPQEAQAQYGAAWSRARPFLLALFAAALLLSAVLLLLPADELPRTDLWDKLEHAATFAALMLIGAAALPAAGMHPLLRLAWVAFGLMLFGALCEGLQSFVPGRETSIADAVANGVGVFAGVATAYAIARMRARRTREGPIATARSATARSATAEAGQAG